MSSTQRALRFSESAENGRFFFALSWSTWRTWCLKKRGYTLVFSINIGVNKAGVVDTIIFSGGVGKDTSRLFDLKKISRGLKGNTDFGANKNEVLVLMVVLTRGDEYFMKLENGDQYMAYWNSISNEYQNLRALGRKQVTYTY